MKDGLTQQVGTPLEVYARPRNRIVASFIGSPSMNFLQGTVHASDGGMCLEASGFRLRIGSVYHRSLEKYLGQRVTFGMRPEAILATQPTTPEAIPATVEVVEPLGAEILLDMRVGNDTVVARVPPHTRTEPRQLIHLAFSPDRMHSCDPETDEAVV